MVELRGLEPRTSSMPLKRSHDNSSAYGGIKHHPTPSSSHKIALRDYIQSLHNRGLSDNYIETSEKFLRRYLDWLGNTFHRKCRKIPLTVQSSQAQYSQEICGLSQSFPQVSRHGVWNNHKEASLTARGGK